MNHVNALNQVASSHEDQKCNILNIVDTINSHKYQGIHPFACILWKYRDGEGSREKKRESGVSSLEMREEHSIFKPKKWFFI